MRHPVFGFVMALVLVGCPKLARSEPPIIVGDDGSVFGLFPSATGEKAPGVLRFGLPRAAAARLWREGEALRGLWIANGIRYTETILAIDLPSPAPESKGQPAVVPVVLVNIEGENTNAEYAEASAALTLELGGQRQDLELKDGFVWRRQGDANFLLGALEVPQSGITASHGDTLRFSGNMPPSLKGTMTWKIPLAPIRGDRALERLTDLDVDLQLRRSLDPRERSAGNPDSAPVFAHERLSARSGGLLLAPPGTVRAIKVHPDQAPDCASLRSIAESVTRGCRNNDEKAIAIYNFMQLSHYHRAYPTEPAGLPVLKEIHCYGWSLCGGLHTEQSALWRQLGWDWRFVLWDGHETVEAQYDGRWHYLDVFLKFYAWMPDGQGSRTLAGEDDLNEHAQALIGDAFVLDEGRRCVYRKDTPPFPEGAKVNWRAPAYLVCGDTMADVIAGLKTRRPAGRVETWEGIRHADAEYSTDVNLASGWSLENTWDPMLEAWYWAGQNIAPSHTCPGHKDTRNDAGIGLVLEPYTDNKPARSYGNGRLVFAPDFSTPAFLQSFISMENVKYADKGLIPAAADKPAVVVLNLASPYILTQARGEAQGADRVEVSVDHGRTFKAVELKDFSAEVKGQVEALVRVTIRTVLKTLWFEAIVQNNPGALPYLSPGRNRVTVSVADPQTLGSNRLVVTYAYRLGSRAKSLEQLCEEGKSIANQHEAWWSEKATFVQRTFSAEDLPATFEIGCPTPKGRYPVYPRMLFLRREVVAPGSLPLPIPAGVVEARVGRDEELSALPNPFLVGTGAPIVQ